MSEQPRVDSVRGSLTVQAVVGLPRRERLTLIAFDDAGHATESPAKAVTVEWVNESGNTVAARRLDKQ